MAVAHQILDNAHRSQPRPGAAPGAGARRWWRLAILVGLCMWLVGGIAMPAAAHLKLQRTEPSDGAVVRRSPPAVVLEFTKAIELGLSTVRVIGADGGAVKTGKLEQANGDSRQLRVPLQGALRGRYAVRYRVVATDGHPIRGYFGFTVRAPAAPASKAPAAGGQQPGSAETAAAS